MAATIALIVFFLSAFIAAGIPEWDAREGKFVPRDYSAAGGMFGIVSASIALILFSRAAVFDFFEGLLGQVSAVIVIISLTIEVFLISIAVYMRLTEGLGKLLRRLEQKMTKEADGAEEAEEAKEAKEAEKAEEQPINAETSQ